MKETVRLSGSTPEKDSALFSVKVAKMFSFTFRNLSERLPLSG